jgi:hypothetical protein
VRETYHNFLLKYFATPVSPRKKIIAYHRRFPTPTPRAASTNQAWETTRIPFRTFASLSIKCQPCGRCGRYNVAKLIARGVFSYLCQGPHAAARARQAAMVQGGGTIRPEPRALYPGKLARVVQRAVPTEYPLRCLRTARVLRATGDLAGSLRMAIV